MKNLFSLALAFGCAFGALAQTTFNVDVSCIPYGFDNLFVTGPWCGWCANDTYNTMTDPDGDGVYSVTVEELTGTVEYKYAINGFEEQENLVNDMVDGANCAPITDFNGYANRTTEAGSTTNDYYGTCDGTCNDVPPTNVKFQVDMAEYEGPFGSVTLNGEFNGWCGNCAPMTDDDGDGVYELTIPLTGDTLQYKFAIGAWEDQEDFEAEASCALTDYDEGAPNGCCYVNRFVVLNGEESIEMPVVCWNSCAACATAEQSFLWTNDVSNCTDWTFGNGSGEAGAPWTDIDINFECTTEGPSGPYNGWAGGNAVGTPQPPLNSSTSDNGLLIIDSDLFGADANYNANWVENCWVQTAEAIDCANYPYVSISFQTRYRSWDNGASDGSEKCFVEVSRDGTSWPGLTNAYTTNWANEGMVNYGGEMVQCRYEVFPESETGYQTENPSFLDFDITEAAGGQETVWIRFRWVGTWGYSWEIDDIAVYETPQNDTRIDNYVSFTNYDQTGIYEYGAWALSQLPETMYAAAKVYNVGYADQSNVMMTVDVNGQTVTSNVIDTLGYTAIDTLVASYAVTEVGTVSLQYTLSQDAEDENPGNNTASQSFEVTDLQWGRDNGEISAAYPGDGTVDYIAMPLYQIENDVTIYGVDVAIMEGTEPNIPVRGFLVDINDPLALEEQYGGELISSPEADLVAGNFNAIDAQGELIWYTFVFDEPYEATAGERLGAAFEHYGGGNVQIGEAQYTADQTAFVYGPFGSGQAYDWYYTNEVPMVRLNLDENAQSPTVFGCMDASACNYNPNANEADGSCEFSSCVGCLDPSACNYNDQAWIDGENCSFSCYGCTDPGAFNFEEDNTVDDGSCIYFEPTCAYLGADAWADLDAGVYSGQMLAHQFGLEVSQAVVLHLPPLIQEPISGSNYNVLVWEELTVTGMPDGLEFDALPPSINGGSQLCLSYGGIPIEEGSFEVQFSGQLILSVFGSPFPVGEYAAMFLVEIIPNQAGIPGCTYALASNFLPFATEDNGSCVFAGCTDPEAVNFQWFATEDDGSCETGSGNANCPSDLDGDGTTGTPDLLAFLASFGLICD